jgi:spore photoproduct lyase
MLINKIFLESELTNNPHAQKILSHFKQCEVQTIDNYQDYWGRVKKPYLEKRENLNLFIAQKKGQLIKRAPDAYGTNTGEHYYYIHAYNCIYECEYCYLQGHFHTPDLVLFVNHQDIIQEMEKLSLNKNEIWFHAGEFSDSLALAHVTGELSLYHDFLQRNPNAKIELRTKSANVGQLLELAPLENLITTFSLSPEKTAKAFDHKTPSVKARLKAMKKLTDQKYPIGIHFDPIVHTDDFKQSYLELIQTLKQQIDIDCIQYISLGVVRFTQEVFHQFKQNYPKSSLHLSEMVTSFDHKVRYPHPIRMWMMNHIKQLLIDIQIPEHKIYLCMEEVEEHA